ncbi:hypothetical protein GC176_23220 [bacterium]|nr:hypothetical protein [bacterium]
MLVSFQTAALAYAGVLLLLVLAAWLLVLQPAGRRARFVLIDALEPALIPDGPVLRCHARRKWHPLAARRGSPECVIAQLPEDRAGTARRF